MSASPRKNRLAFRPALNDIRLEDRVVLNAARPSALIAGVAEARQERLALRQIQQSYLRQIRTTQTFLTQFASDQAAMLAGTPQNWGPDGRLTQEALGNYSNALAGGLNATTFRLASQVSLLPNSLHVGTGIQDGMIGLQANSLASRISKLIGSPRAYTAPWALQNLVNRDINQTFNANVNALGRYFRSTPVGRLAIDPTTGQRIPVSQFLGEQAVTQINNIFGSFANSVGDIAAQTIFDAQGNFNPAGVQTFEQLYAQALGTAGNQIAGVLSLFPNGDSLAAQLQQGLFAIGNDPATGLPNVSLLNALINSLPAPEPPAPAAPIAMALVVGPQSSVTPPIGAQQGPLDLSQFRTTFQSNFTPAFQNLMTPVNSFFGTPQPAGLPTGFFQSGAIFPNVFNSPFTGTTFNSGFNNGFLTSGSGFPGFGIAPSNFPSSFGTGFNGLVQSMNSPFGLTVPTLFNSGVGGIGGIQTGGTGIGGIV